MVGWKAEYEKLINDINVEYKDVKKYINQFIPDKLYRYRAFDDNYKNNIFEGQVYLSHPDKYNDPYDSAVKLDYYEYMKYIMQECNGIDEGIKLSLEKQIKNNAEVKINEIILGLKRHVKIACFAENYDNMNIPTL